MSGLLDKMPAVNFSASKSNSPLDLWKITSLKDLYISTVEGIVELYVIVFSNCKPLHYIVLTDFYIVNVRFLYSKCYH